MPPFFNMALKTEILFDDKTDTPVKNAVSVLLRDMKKTLEAEAAAPNNRIRIMPPESGLAEESWIIETTEDEITLRSADSLGCVYALLFISREFLGVTPFWFWNDQCFTRRPSVHIPLGVLRSPPYTVRFRGWYVNDEVLIENWRADPENLEHWSLVFETLLRCGGNMTIPGTDTNSRKYRPLAAGMGLWITHHHSEPLGAEMFLRAYPGKTPSYTVNKALFEGLWEQGVIAQKEFKVIWSLGFRGQGDRPFWDDDPDYATAEQRGCLISDIINRQYEILTRHVENPICCVNMYGEFTALYRDGYLRLPPGVIKVWADNGYGRMVSRRQGNSNPRLHSLPAKGDAGPHGIYYHCSFHDLQASNHLTMFPNPAELLVSELGKALEADAGEYWIINSGSVKPHVHVLDLAGEIWRSGKVDAAEWRKGYAETYYGKENASAIAALFGEYASCTARYGPNDDDRAGEQIWHHPVRELLCRWMSRDTETCLESLIWLAGTAQFSDQVKGLESIAVKSLPQWEAFCKKCAALRDTLDENARRLFDDTLFLHGRLQQSGAAGAAAFCASFRAFASGDTAKAFTLAEKSRSCYEAGVAALAEAEHGEWIGYYRGDCLTDIRLTGFCLNALVSYLRVLGDGPDFHEWERKFLIPATESSIMLLSCKQRALTNGELAAGLGAALG
ncbi:hypothetical protein AGMMS49991_03810 [Spirochaetia bacterium]|nr:hypothetical protein AGMMS49991_03810 [Spirochaetia bacterium]